MVMMPPVFTYLMASFPAGLVIYWTANNILSIGQQYVIMRRMNVPIDLGKNFKPPAWLKLPAKKPPDQAPGE
jgi:YidC/Oxa1 family membrane protein insertase